MKYLASVSYNGGSFYGFQKLNKEKTVQGEIERVLTLLNKSEVFIKGAGRTDRYVHAKDQKIHFEIDFDISCNSLKKAMNSMLDDSIYINYIKEVSDDFHARFNVKKKVYEYIINIGEYDPIINDHVYNYNKKLDIKAMKKASTKLIGAHSYKAFVSGYRDNYNSIIYNVNIKKRGNFIYMRFTGKSFYRYMVRNLVGALIMVGKQEISYKAIEEMINSGEKTYNYMTVPAQGLYLISIDY